MLLWRLVLAVMCRVWWVLLPVGAGCFLCGRSDQAGRHTPRRTVPQCMWHIYSQVDGGLGDVVQGVSSNTLGEIQQGRLEMQFLIPRRAKTETLVKAQICLTNQRGCAFQVLQRINRTAVNAKSGHGRTWVSLDVTGAVGETSKVLSVLLSVMRCRTRPRAEELEPVLLLTYRTDKTNKVHSRGRRNADNRHPGSTWTQRWRNTCRREPLFVDFSDISYDSWIIAPHGYQAYHCVGRCNFPVGDHLTPTAHAIVQTLMHDVAPRRTHGACCVPTRLEPISMLYVDSGGVLTYRFRYRDMVVAECGCR